MARFAGEVGYGETAEIKPGVWDDVITEYPYQGDIIRKSSQLQTADKLNSDIVIDNSISIVADEYAVKHFSKIKYVRWDGVVWTVTSVEVRAPRLILSIGSVYNGPTV